MMGIDGVCDNKKVSTPISSDNFVPILPANVVAFFDIDNILSYDINSFNEINTLLGVYDGTIFGDTDNLDDPNVTPTAGNHSYGTDTATERKFWKGAGRVANHNIKINSSINLTNWSAKYVFKHESNVGMAYLRMLGTRNYYFELVTNRLSEIWFYDPTGGWWNNTGASIPNDGKFHDLDWTYNNSPRELNIYLNGDNIYSSTSKGRSLVSNGWWWVQGSEDNRNHNQPLNKFILYDRELTQAEIASNLVTV